MRFAAPILSAAIALLLVLAPTVVGQSGFFDSFDGTPTTPTPYSNPNSWDIFVQGFNPHETGLVVPGGDPRGGNIAQHGPNCEPPGFPYTPQNSHVMQTQADAVFLCGSGDNTHLMTSPGLTGYGAVYMIPPAVADFSNGPATIAWDMSTLRSSARDWVDIVLTPWAEQSQMAYNNNDQHIPIHNLHVSLAGTNVFLASQRINGGVQYAQGQDVTIQGDGATTWDQVFQAQNPPMVESASRRDTFTLTLTRTTISVCLAKLGGVGDYSYHGQSPFCWLRNAALPQPLDDSVWHGQTVVQINHRTYNPEKSCIDTQVPPPPDPIDSANVDHTAYSEVTCPNDTWHWDNVNFRPAVPFTATKSVPESFESHTGSPTTVSFASPSQPGGYLTFVAFSHTPDLRVSYDGGATWAAPHIQPAIAPNNGASEENGEAIFDPMPAGLTSIMVRGNNGFWGTFEAEAFHLIGPPSGQVITTPTDQPTASPTATATAQPTDTPTATPTAVPTATSVPTDMPTVAPTSMPTDVPVATPTSLACEVEIWLSGSSQGRKQC